jgi:hypothetical protein
MYTEQDLDSAVQAGALTSEAAAALRAHIATIKGEVAVDQEHFRLVTGFNDIFVVIACVLLLISLGWIGGTISPTIGAAVVSLASWLLAEFFTRKKRMALPSIILLLSCVGGAHAAAMFLFKGLDFMLLASSLIAAVVAALHWRRFHVPITVAAGAATIASAALACLMWLVPSAGHWIPLLSFWLGVAIFIAALRWDSSDTARQTQRSDVAFWLHLLAAPLIVHPIFTMLGIFEGKAVLSQGLTVLLLYIAIAIISLCIDRRALMVSALAYVLYAFNTLLKQYGMIDMSFAITALTIGAALLLLSAFWHKARERMLRLLPPFVLARLAKI